MSTKILVIPILVSLGACALAGLAWQSARQRAASEQSDQRALDESVRALAAELRGLREQQEQSARDLKALRDSASLRAPAETRVPEGAIEAAVARWMAEHAAAGALGAPAAASEPDVFASALRADAKTMDLNEALRFLFDESIDEMEREELWKKLSEAGRLDELIAMLEKQVELDPNDPGKQMELGYGYVQKIMEVGNGPLAGKWATKADQQWDKALEIDPKHWDARFAKAIGLSFWPPIFGKQAEAIKHFEILAAQQESGPLESDYVQTYLLLGNMYQQSGDKEKAQATWKKGLELFPGNESLAQQLGQGK